MRKTIRFQGFVRSVALNAAHFPFQVMSLSPTTTNRSQTNLHPLTIRHDSFFKAVWDWFILALVIFTAIEIPYTAAFILKPYSKTELKWSFQEDEILRAVNIWVDLMFVLDIMINFRTTYVETKTEEIVTSPRQIALHYLKTWFVVDCVAAVPFEFMVNRKQGEGVSSNIYSFYKNLSIRT